MFFRLKSIFVILLISFLTALLGAEKGNYSEEGFASYYAEEFNGRRTANGETFDMTDYTAAHRTLPFNTFLKITNLENNLSLLIRVNDRGPFIKNRIIDLSEAAARRIGCYQRGLTKVRVEEIELTPLIPEHLGLFLDNLVIDCLGNMDILSGNSLSIWSSEYLLHTLYIANDLYLREDVEKVLICPRGKGKYKRFHIVMSGIATKAEAKQMKDYYERLGFMNVQYFR